ncbi:MAG: hypothetical protein ACTSYY_15985 [Promethearchaeota archaeon]
MRKFSEKFRIFFIVLFYSLLFTFQYILFSRPVFGIIGSIFLLIISLLLLKYKFMQDISGIFSFSLKDRKFKKSVILSTIIITPINLAWLFGWIFVGSDLILEALQPSWAISPVTTSIILIREGKWLFCVCLYFILWIAVPYELLKTFGKKFLLIIIPVLFSCLYNAPIITGKWDPIDIIFFAFLFSYIYHKTQNIWGICIAYFIVENPFWWGIAALFGNSMPTVFLILLIIRILIGIILFCVYLIFIRKRKENKNEKPAKEKQ